MMRICRKTKKKKDNVQQGHRETTEFFWQSEREEWFISDNNDGKYPGATGSTRDEHPELWTTELTLPQKDVLFQQRLTTCFFIIKKAEGFKDVHHTMEKKEFLRPFGNNILKLCKFFQKYFLFRSEKLPPWHLWNCHFFLLKLWMEETFQKIVTSARSPHCHFKFKFSFQFHLILH